MGYPGDIPGGTRDCEIVRACWSFRGSCTIIGVACSMEDDMIRAVVQCGGLVHIAENRTSTISSVV